MICFCSVLCPLRFGVLQAIGVPISKLAMHTACGGVEPATTMPVVFDVGTDNEELLRSPLYVGVRHRWACISCTDWHGALPMLSGVQLPRCQSPKVRQLIAAGPALSR